MQFRLTAPSLDFWVDVRLRNFGDRWIAVAEIAGEFELGMGLNARAALSASLSSLGTKAASALLAGPQLVGQSLDQQKLREGEGRSQRS